MRALQRVALPRRMVHVATHRGPDFITVAVMKHKPAGHCRLLHRQGHNQ